MRKRTAIAGSVLTLGLCGAVASMLVGQYQAIWAAEIVADSTETANAGTPEWVEVRNSTERGQAMWSDPYFSSDAWEAHLASERTKTDEVEALARAPFLEKTDGILWLPALKERFDAARDRIQSLDADINSQLRALVVFDHACDGHEAGFTILPEEHEAAIKAIATPELCALEYDVAE